MSREIEIKLGSEVGALEKNKNRKHLKRTCDGCGDVKWILLKAMWRAAMMSHQLCPKCRLQSFSSTNELMYK